MSKQAADHHKKAAEHHEHAARHHREAAKHHEAGAHEKAAHHAVSLCPACTAAVSSSGVGDRRGGANPAPGTPLRVSAAGGHRRSGECRGGPQALPRDLDGPGRRAAARRLSLCCTGTAPRGGLNPESPGNLPPPRRGRVEPHPRTPRRDERLREPTTSAAAQSSARRTSVRFVDSSRPEGPRPEGPCPGEPP